MLLDRGSTNGRFRRLRHDHFFEPVDGGTLMRDVFEFSSGLPPLDAMVLRRNAVIKDLAEGDGRRDYVPERPY